MAGSNNSASNALYTVTKTKTVPLLQLEIDRLVKNGKAITNYLNMNIRRRLVLSVGLLN
jgi:hypothetical protein